MEIFDSVLEKFLRYVSYDTSSDEESESFPSTEKQKVLGRLLAEELSEMGIETCFDEKNSYVYGKIPSNRSEKGGRKVAFISHMDTSPEVSGKDVKTVITKNYGGGDILLAEDGSRVLSPKKYPELANYVGQTVISTDGTTLLGADDKAGIAEIMTMCEYLTARPEKKHGEIRICFTPDEEIGRGTNRINFEKLDADCGYTVDGGAFGEIEYENFNASSAEIKIKGQNVHPGDAKGKMKNASRIAMELNSMLPKDEKPENTEGYEGFYHLISMKGDVENAELSYIIRDHDIEKFRVKNHIMQEICDKINTKYGAGTCCLNLRDQYFNMKEKIIPDNYFLIEAAEKALKDLGFKAEFVPIRGGTDGAVLSYKGLPCPNLCTGGHNFHGRFEYITAESMEKTVKMLLKIAEEI